jgi:hypothetical protein
VLATLVLRSEPGPIAQPSLSIEIFEPGVVSTDLDELNAAIAPDRSELYYSINSPGDQMGVIVRSRRNGSRWEYCPIASPDGAVFFWTSKRGFLDQPPARPYSAGELKDSLRSIRNGGGSVYSTPLGRLLEAVPARGQ